MELQVINAKNAASGKCKLPEAIFGTDYNEALIHQVVTSYAAGSRQGTKAQKNRAAVSGGGAKPWRQKGTGRARAGTTRGPIWRTGGVTFAAQPRDHSKKVNRKMYRAAIRSIWAELVRQDRVVAIDNIDVDTPKTKALAGILKNLSMSDVLIVTDNVTENLYLASRNIPYVDVRDVIGLDPMSLIAYEKVLVTVEAIKQLEEWLA